MLKSLLLSCLLLEAGSAQRWTRTQRPQPTTTIQAPSSVQSLYGQCGGQTYTGPTRCPPGAYCKNDGNIWYEQCVAIEQDGNSGQPSATIRTLTTVFSVGPTVVSTYITYLSPKPTKTASASIVTITLVPDDPCDHDYLC
ncbi:hypothetical protein C8A00DRAFT_17425 [Chaetomidium leptoderma]|uniref:CBM1 domain-containing protein n=1 Tax=Chaetomidium leptoderma TaxID=669021 RepID=A0AAN6VJ49_9PEZI|nr:hypothetical protein C8A00DRAFT_17425 [Chaetomidium leptoderma]